MLGVVDLKEVLQAKVDAKLEDIMTTSVISLNPENTLIEASEMFYVIASGPFLLLMIKIRSSGVVPYRDIMNLKHRFV